MTRSNSTQSFSLAKSIIAEQLIWLLLIVTFQLAVFREDKTHYMFPLLCVWLYLAFSSSRTAWHRGYTDSQKAPDQRDKLVLIFPLVLTIGLWFYAYSSDLAGGIVWLIPALAVIALAYYRRIL